MKFYSKMQELYIRKMAFRPRWQGMRVALRIYCNVTSVFLWKQHLKKVRYSSFYNNYTDYDALITIM